jgi:hypothetical protein
MMNIRKIPWWVWLIAIPLSAAQPILLFCIRHAPPSLDVPSGLHIPDSALFLYSMDMFKNGFYSAYATCHSPGGLAGLEFYSVPHLWLYGALGALARLVHADYYAAYGVANGFGAFCYLLAAYVLLREIAPKQANAAFVLFALSGGLGGVTFVFTGVMGFHNLPGFEEVFRRFASYELFEGPHLLPSLLFPRFYYTFSLALCFGALAMFIRGVRLTNPAWFLLTTLFLPLGAFIDLRFGAFTLGVAALYLCSRADLSAITRLNYGVSFFVRFLCGAVPAFWLMRLNPTVIANHLQVTNMAMWLSPFIATAFFHLLLLPGEMRARSSSQSILFRIGVGCAVGYLTAFALMFLVYQAYFGNILVARDAAVANAISDWALLGALLGCLRALKSMADSSKEKRAGEWIPLWLVAYLALSISAFGHGLMLKFGPQRIETFLWLPLCVMSASALQRMREREWFSTGLLRGVMIVCGICSIAASLLCFQGPYSFPGQKRLYPENHAEVMTRADAAVMARIGAGVVLAPIPASDIIVRTRGNRVVFGTGTFNLSDQPYAPLNAAVTRFFSKDADDDYRRQFIEDWCVEYIYCPDAWAVDPEVAAQLRKTPWLEEIASQGSAALFRIATDHVVVASSSG